MDFYLSYNNKEDELRLPVTPDSFEISITTNNKVINIQNIGDVALIGKLGLASISINSFFPAQEYNFCKYRGFPSPDECVALIKKWQNSGRPIRLIITGTDINYAMTINNFKYGINDKTKDLNFTLDLSEYKFLKTNTTEKTIITSNGTDLKTVQTKRETKEIEDITHIVSKGETLWLIAKRFTGNGENYKAIAKANGIDNPNLIYPGQVIKI